MDATADELIARLRRNPDDASASAALRAHYQRVGDYPSLAALLESVAGRNPDDHRAAAMFFEAAEIVWGALGDRPRSIRLYERALERSQAHSEAALRLQAFYEEAGDQRRLVELLERRAEALSAGQAEPRDIASIHHRLGEIWEHGFQRADKAIFHYRKAFELDPTLVPAIYAAREIYRQAGNLKAAATLCDLEAKAEADPERKVALLRELAHLRAHELADLEGAVVALKRALGIAPGELEVMQDLSRVYLARAERTADAMVADSDRRRAADVLYQIAQKVPPVDAVASLESALDNAPDHDGALGLLERIAEHVGHFELLPRRWIAFLERVADAPESRDRRKRLARAYLDAGQIEYAISCLEWLLEEGDSEAASTLSDLYRRAGRENDALRALAIAAEGLSTGDRLPKLRDLLAMLVQRDDRSGAVQAARQILELDPGDADALGFLEERYRKDGDWHHLRELLINVSRVPGLPIAARTARLREVARLSESQLGDDEGAIHAWRGVASIDPSDRDARHALARLLEVHERWDDLIALLARDALAALDPKEKAEIHRSIARIHRTHRGDLAQAIAALRDLRELLPEDLQARDALCDALVAAGAWLEAIPILRQRIEGADPAERSELLRIVARALEEHVGDDEGAFQAWSRLLEDVAGDPEAITRMVAIDERNRDFDRLLRTLHYRAQFEDGETQIRTFVSIARIADAELDDLARAAEFYLRALEMSKGDESLLDALTSTYERSGRHKELVTLLREKAKLTQNLRDRAEIERRVARLALEYLANPDLAREAYEAVLDAGDDVEALEYLAKDAEVSDDVRRLEEYCQRLADLSPDAQVKTDKLFERATLLAERLDRPRDAIEVLQRVVREISPGHVPSLALLADLCTQVGDAPGLADALERTLTQLEDPELRIPVAQSLADLYEQELHEPERAIVALGHWADADLTEPEPQRRLAALLESAGRHRELVDALDALAGITENREEAWSLGRRAADRVASQLNEPQAAFDRYAELTREGDSQSEPQLRRVGEMFPERLAEFYASSAETEQGASRKKQLWQEAARVRETHLHDPTGALEAYLKAFALDLDDRRLLDEVDRLGSASAAWPRLSQVYETLIRRTEEREEKITLLLRLAILLETSAREPSDALDLALRACSLALSPEGNARFEDALAIAERLASAAEREEELFLVYDRMRAVALDDRDRVDALLRALRASERSPGDGSRTTSLLEQCIALGVRGPELLLPLENECRTLAILPALVAAYERVALEGHAPARAGAALLERAAGLLDAELDASERAFSVLLRATELGAPESSAYEAIETLAHRISRTSELDAHYAKLIDEAVDQKLAAELLRRRGALLERLGKFAETADVYARLKAVSPNDWSARKRLRLALRREGRWQDLLLALDADVAKAKGNSELVLSLSREIAAAWERGLANRWEAIEAWQKLEQLAPGDPEAEAAIARLSGDKTGKLEPDPEFSKVSDSDLSGIHRVERFVSEPESAPESYQDREEVTSDSRIPTDLLTDHRPFDTEIPPAFEETASGELSLEDSGVHLLDDLLPTESAELEAFEHEIEDVEDELLEEGTKSGELLRPPTSVPPPLPSRGAPSRPPPLPSSPPDPPGSSPPLPPGRRD